jgi:hypothetical protein
VTDDKGKPTPLNDKTIDTEWSSRNKNVMGRFIDIDLGADVGVQKVVILAGSYLQKYNKPEFYIKGYKIAIAASDDPGDFRVVAEQPVNTRRDVNTSDDATWLRKYQSGPDKGKPIPTIGRYLKVTITREDGDNWVVIGEIQVFGTGYQKHGYYTSKPFNAGTANFGEVKWDAQVPEGTILELQFRSGTSTTDWDRDWQDAPVVSLKGSSGSFLMDVTEGLKAGTTNATYSYVQYRAHLLTTVSDSTSELESVTVQYDDKMVSTAAYASISPDTARIWDEKKGRVPSLTYEYTVDLGMRTADHGVKQVRLTNVPGAVVNSVRVGDQAVAFQSESEGPDVYVTLTDMISPSQGLAQVLHVLFTLKILTTDTSVRGQIASLDTAPPGSYVNFQNLQESKDVGHTWSVTVEGIPPDAMPQVTVEPNPFNPVSGTPASRREAAFVCDIAKITVPRELEISIFTLAGKRVCVWSGFVDAGSSVDGQWKWDGRNETGDLVSPGIYVYQVILMSDAPSVKSGLIGVAY